MNWRGEVWKEVGKSLSGGKKEEVRNGRIKMRKIRKMKVVFDSIS